MAKREGQSIVRKKEGRERRKSEGERGERPERGNDCMRERQRETTQDNEREGDATQVSKEE